jgi:hypothetical protein
MDEAEVVGIYTLGHTPQSNGEVCLLKTRNLYKKTDKNLQNSIAKILLVQLIIGL